MKFSLLLVLLFSCFANAKTIRLHHSNILPAAASEGTPVYLHVAGQIASETQDQVLNEINTVLIDTLDKMGSHVQSSFLAEVDAASNFCVSIVVESADSTGDAQL